ncbi:MAG: 4-hydroxybenzoate octaprenyltransferase [Zetaproteobacteria bacterium]|nr:4-hydroxybenzoate octaprenyltransferase [Zetaproteobacteria bacterium]
MEALVPPLLKRLNIYGRLMRVEKPIGTYLVMWPMLWALWIAAEGHPDGFVVLLFLLGAFLMRSAGCVINDIADRNVDGHVARTKLRPLAAGEIRTKEALALFIVLLLMAAGLLLFLNDLTKMISIGAVVLAILYPFMKRVTHLPQIFLGAAFAWSIPMAFSAIQAGVPLIGWVLLLATICWVVAYDTMYAMVDRDDDLKIGVKSTAILFADYDRLIIGILQLAMLALLILVGFMVGLGILYYFGLVLAAGLGIYQQLLIQHRQREACFQAFLNNHYLGGWVFAGLFLDYATIV